MIVWLELAGLADLEGGQVVSERYRQTYAKTYAENAAKTGARGGLAYIDEADYLARCRGIYDKFCEGKPLPEQVDTWLTHLKAPGELTYRDALLTDDVPGLNDSLFQTAVIAHAGQVWSGGTDHSHFYRTVKQVLAAGMFDRVPLLLPEELGLSVQGHPDVVAQTNLLMALWYGREDFARTARAQAERRLEVKGSNLQKAGVRYLLALLDDDPETASAHLLEYVTAVARVSAFGVGPLQKLFWPLAHGLHNLAWQVWPEGQAQSLALPEHERFCADLARWQVGNGFPAGTLRINYPEPMGIVNTILTTTPPPAHLHQPYLGDPNMQHLKSKKFYDADRFRRELIVAVTDNAASQR